MPKFTRHLPCCSCTHLYQYKTAQHDQYERWCHTWRAATRCFRVARLQSHSPCRTVPITVVKQLPPSVSAATEQDLTRRPASTTAGLFKSYASVSQTASWSLLHRMPSPGMSPGMSPTLPPRSFTVESSVSKSMFLYSKQLCMQHTPRWQLLHWYYISQKVL